MSTACRRSPDALPTPSPTHGTQPSTLDRGSGVPVTRPAPHRPGTAEGPATSSVAGRGPFWSCAPVGIRTPNLLIRSQMLYPLSYGRPSAAVRNDGMRIADASGDAEITLAARTAARGWRAASYEPVRTRL